MKTLRFIAATAGLATAVAAVVTLSAPASTSAWTTIGGSLGVGGTTQRDFRVWNNFTDTQANNNTAPHPNFPGQTGATMAIWKGHVEWASEGIGGNGLGDGVGSNPVLGSGGANFDNTFQGLTTSAGNSNQNIHSEQSGSSGSTLAYTLTPISDGWKIRYYSTWTWKDGPGSVSSGTDIQGVACHEVGHSLGLGHTGVGGSTMTAFISGTGVSDRSIASDDINGVQAIYGSASGSKPRITGISGTFEVGETITISGSDFSGSNNEIWYTKVDGGNGQPLKVTGVSSSGGGTSITTTVPGGIQDGDVMVKKNASGHSSLSNAWPFDLDTVAGADPSFLAEVQPTAVWTGGFQPVTLPGSGSTGATGVLFDATPVISFVVDSDVQITAVSPAGPFADTATVTVLDPDGNGVLSDSIGWIFNPGVQIDTVTPDSGEPGGGELITITGPSVVGAYDVTFGGVSGTNLEVVSATELEVQAPAGTGTVNVTVFNDDTLFGGTNDTVTNGYTYASTGEFIDLGPGKSGTGGLFPLLTGDGDLTPGSPDGFVLSTIDVLPNAPGVLFFALTECGGCTFKGAPFYPNTADPAFGQFDIGVDGTGQLDIPATMDPSIPSGTEVVLQNWFSDAGAPKNVSATNGLKLIVP